MFIADNYRHEGERLRGGFRYNITLIQDEVKEQMRNSSREMWACDPDNYIYNGPHQFVSVFLLKNFNIFFCHFQILTLR